MDYISVESERRQHSEIPVIRLRFLCSGWKKVAIVCHDADTKHIHDAKWPIVPIWDNHLTHGSTPGCHRASVDSLGSLP